MIASDLEPGEEPLYRAAVVRLNPDTLRNIGKAFAYLTDRNFHFVRMTASGGSVARCALRDLYLVAEDFGRVMLVFKSGDEGFAAAAFRVEPHHMASEFASGATLLFEQLTGRPFSNP